MDSKAVNEHEDGDRGTGGEPIVGGHQLHGENPERAKLRFFAALVMKKRLPSTCHDTTVVRRRKQTKQQISLPTETNSPKFPATHSPLALSSQLSSLPTNFQLLPNAPIHHNQPPILLHPPPPPPQMASRLGFNFNLAKTARIRKPFFSASSLPSPAPGVHSVQFGTNKLSLRRRLLFISPRATSEQPGLLSAPHTQLVYEALQQE